MTVSDSQPSMKCFVQIFDFFPDSMTSAGKDHIVNPHELPGKQIQKNPVLQVKSWTLTEWTPGKDDDVVQVNHTASSDETRQHLIRGSLENSRGLNSRFNCLKSNLSLHIIRKVIDRSQSCEGSGWGATITEFCIFNVLVSVRRVS
ncbi:hypothetical protein CAPTEDRAFT_187715 [Capitella teleta]|uniref:Uncharacterized protein n=1 Tax=Capitella teleta TaxID=283909 RepID=R7TLF6_CAPTE|nr:hypothetical protein CAPTEDRAFT_187715 [Capitella teleta]|eukprot:ELT94678.1 hypothetical protein CAPTEDRAFT_187715 [Capitella teleta]